MQSSLSVRHDARNIAPVSGPALSPAAAKALDITPSEIIARWLANLSPAALRSYKRALRSFCGWALADADANPERALQLLVEAGCGPAHSLVTEWRDHLLSTGLSSGSRGRKGIIRRV